MVKRLMLIIIFMMMFVPVGMAAENNRIVESITTIDTVGASIDVPSTGIRRTKTISVKQNPPNDEIVLMYRAEGSTINLKIDLEQSYIPPVTESAYDDKWMTTESVDSSVVTTLWRIATIDTVSLPYMRFKITGQGSNAATTRLLMKVVK